jgi:hypothetical protein
MCPAVDNLASCEFRAFIRFLHTKNVSAAEIHSELCKVYGRKVMSKRTVRQRCTIFKDRRTNVHDEEGSVRPSVVSDDLFQSVDQKICERRCFTIAELSCEFPQILHTLFYEIITSVLLAKQ